MTPRFVITGCQRSGMRYAAAVLSALGCECGHQTFFAPDAPRMLGDSPPVGDSSWFAAPFVSELPTDTVVFHQVRHPLSVIQSSLARTTLFSGRATGVARTARMFVQQRCPIAAEGDPVIRCMNYWTHWNRMIEKQAEAAGLPYCRYDLERFGTFGLLKIVFVLGLRYNQEDMRAASSARKCGRRRIRDKTALEITLSDLPAGYAKEDMLGLARRYGYCV